MFHLRKELTKNPAKDIRFLYLALHSILKHRGHFISSVDYEVEQSINNTKDVINSLVELYNEIYCEEFGKLSLITNENDISFLFEQKLSKTQAKKEAKIIFNAPKGIASAICECLVNGQFNTKIFNKDYEVKVDFNLEEDKMNEAETILSEDEFELLLKLKETFQLIQLKKILNNQEYICDAMVEIYENHKTQLKMFKDFISKYYPPVNGEKSEFSKMFRNPISFDNKGKVSESKNYASYIVNDLENNKKLILNYDNKKLSQEDFYKEVKKLLKKAPTISNYNEEEFLKTKIEIESLMENNMFLTKLRTSSNSLFPNSLYIKEINAILNANEEKFPFLKEADEYGTIKEKILKIFKYRVPYYVGPITTKDNTKYKWVQYKDTSIKLYPWTLDKIVDLDQTEQNFIEKMTNKCTYLGKDILPKNSIIYQRFCVLNELNKLTIDGENISSKLKQEIFENLFCVYKKVSNTKLKAFLVAKGYSKELQIGGIDNQFANSYQSFVTFEKKFGKEFVYENLEMFEEIIKLHTILSDKQRVVNILSKKYDLDENIKKFIKSLNFQGWGRLSKEFLELEIMDESTGEISTILNRMYDTNQNLNEIINDPTLTKSETTLNIHEYLREISIKQTEITYSDIENTYASPSVKRATWQAIKIVKEITQLMGRKPEKIFIEVTRHDENKDDKGRKDSRENKIQKIYQNKDFLNEFKVFDIDLKTLNDNLNNESDVGKLRSEKLYLYYLQNGKCMYSLENISINELQNYDIDHIIPQSILKDDSFDNKVLVKKELNESSNIGKGDKFPIYEWNKALYQKCKPYWEFLYNHNLISKKKLDRLTRKSELSEDEKLAFINRQLVETNQSVKLVCDLLKGYVDKPQNIVYSKANNVTEFRKEFEIVKFRDINNYHHAKDAYLNIVVGNVLDNRFTQRYKKDKDRTYNNKEIQQEENINNNRTYHIINLFKSDKPIYKYNDKNIIVWNKNEHLPQVKQICNRNSCTISFFTTLKENGSFYDQSIYKSSINDRTTKASVPLKGNDGKYHFNNKYGNIEKYGGYNSVKNSYLMVIESKDEKGNKRVTIESVPTYICQKYKNHIDKEEKILEYITTINKLKEPKILLEKLRYRSLLLIGGGKYLITAKTGTQYALKNVNQYNAKEEIVKYSKTLAKYLEYTDELKSKLIRTEDYIIVSERQKNKSEIITREKNINMFNSITNQLEKDFYISRVVYEKMKKGFDIFKILDLDNQSKQILNLIKYLGGTEVVDLTNINGAAMCGKININKDITQFNVTLIQQSVTGLMEKRIKLK